MNEENPIVPTEPTQPIQPIQPTFASPTPPAPLTPPSQPEAPVQSFQTPGGFVSHQMNMHTSQVNMPPQKKSKLPSIIITLLILVGLAGGTVYAYYNFLAPKLSPEEILNKSIQNTLTIKSYSFTSTTTGDISTNVGDMPFSIKLNFSASGDVDFKSVDEFAVRSDSVSKIDLVSASGTGAVSAGISMISTNKDLYLNFKDFSLTFNSSDPEMSGTQILVGMANGLAASLKDKWIKISPDESFGSSTPQAEISDENIQALKTYFASLKYITEIQNVGSEKVGDADTYHLKMKMQHGQELVDIIKSIALKSASTSDAMMIDEEMKDLSKILTQSIDTEIWVGEKDFLVYRVKLNAIKINDEKIGMTSTLSQEMSLSNHNKTMTISAPAGAVPIEEILQQVFGSMFNVTPPTSTSIKTKK